MIHVERQHWSTTATMTNMPAKVPLNSYVFVSLRHAYLKTDPIVGFRIQHAHNQFAIALGLRLNPPAGVASGIAGRLIRRGPLFNLTNFSQQLEEFELLGYEHQALSSQE